MGKNKKTISLSINKDVDDFFESLRFKVIVIDGKKIQLTNTKNEIYNRALEYAMIKINDWFHTGDGEE